MVGRVDSLFVTILEDQQEWSSSWVERSYRFFKLSPLSSIRPLGLPRSRHRATHIYSKMKIIRRGNENQALVTVPLQSRKRTHWIWTLPSTNIIFVSRKPIDREMILLAGLLRRRMKRRSMSPSNVDLCLHSQVVCKWSPRARWNHSWYDRWFACPVENPAWLLRLSINHRRIDEHNQKSK